MYRKFMKGMIKSPSEASVYSFKRTLQAKYKFKEMDCTFKKVIFYRKIPVRDFCTNRKPQYNEY